KTPLKQPATSNSALTEIQPDGQPLTTPTKPKEGLPAEPWTPTSNLKMLISAASPEIRSREQRRQLLNDPSEEHLLGEEYEKSHPSRKEKSLGLLCHKFLARYPDYPSSTDNSYISLDEVAEELKVERRRIYDIVNVLESLHMVSRLAKNRYAWHGRHNLPKTLQALKKVGENNKYTQQIQLIKRREYEHEFDLDGDRKEGMPKSIASKDSEMSFVELPGMEFRAASVNSRKDKSLRVMSQKFVMLFLVSTPQIVSLDVAAKILIGEEQLEDLDKSKFKTKIRRLYDIANVLSSLQLIKKVHLTEERGRKPAFEWIGPDVLPNTQDTKLETSSTTCSQAISEYIPPKEQCSKNLFPSRGKQSFTRHPSLIKLVKTIENDRRKIQSAPTSPVKRSASTDQNLSAFPSEMAQDPAIAKHQLEGQSKKEKENKMKLSRPASKSHLPLPEVAPKPEPLGSTAPCQLAALTQTLGVCAPGHTSVSPVILPHPHPGVSYAIYLQPSQAHSVVLQPLPCANVTGIKSVNSKVLNPITTEEGDNQIATDDPTKSVTAKERPPTTSETSPQRCLKRSQALEEISSIKRRRRDAESLDTHLTFFPSGYLIPLTQCSHGSKAGFSDKEKAEVCPAQHTAYSSPITGVIPVTGSELKAVNIPAFHITPLNIMLSPTSIAAAPVLGNSSLNSSNTSSPQIPASSVLNFTLQHIGLIPAGVQVPANPFLQHMPASSQAENVTYSSEKMSVQEEKVRKNRLHLADNFLSCPQPPVPKEAQEPQTVTENFFRTPGGPNTEPPLSAKSDGTAGTSPGTLYIPQRKLEVSED
ncbi:E2F8 factor, partial [Semnornis frantzii]|nr:E2F8 factor [Semnornis frantzii]